MHVRFIFAVLLLFGILAGCAGKWHGESKTTTLVAIATTTAIPSPMDSTSLPTPMQTPTHTPAEASSPTPALPVAITPTLPPTPTVEAAGTLQPVEDTSPTWTPQALPGTWRELVLAPEERCSPYDSDDYPYSQSVENRIVEAMSGLVYGPYSGIHFENTRQTDIEHIVARSEAHDSGLCAADAHTKKRFSSDLLNLTWPARRSIVTRRAERMLRNGFRTSTSAGLQTGSCRFARNTNSPLTRQRPPPLRLYYLDAHRLIWCSTAPALAPPLLHLTPRLLMTRLQCTTTMATGESPVRKPRPTG